MYFSNKHSFVDSKIALNENSEIVTENLKIAKTFNSYFESITNSLELYEPAVTCSKLTIETLEQGVKFIQS